MDLMDNKEVNTAQTPPAPPSCPGGQIYTVRAGDTLFLIAQRYGIPLQRLIAANPQIVDPNMILVGQRICVPLAPTLPDCVGIRYTVVRCDTLFEIARRFGVTLDALLAANPQIINPDLIFPGQVICIPVTAPPCPTGFYYTVVRGDTLFGIAHRLGITLNELLRLNPQITDPDRINIGQRICVPLPVPPAVCEGEYYIVRSGETLSGIAQRYNVSVQEILRVNPQIIDPNMIYAGQVICIPRRERIEPIPLPRPIPAPAPTPIPRPPAPRPCPPPVMPSPIPERPAPCPPPMMPAPMPGPCPPDMPYSPMPCPPGGSMPGMPYPSYEGPFFVIPPVRWGDCPYAPRNRFRRPRRRFFR